MLGAKVTTGGLVQLGSADTISVTLVSLTGHLLAEVTADPTGVGSWEAELEIPEHVSGPAEIRATLLNGPDEVAAADVNAVDLELDPAGKDRYLELYRPLVGETGVAGFNLFFDGRAVAPVNNVVTISVWTDQCQTQAARQSFNLSGSGYWQGFVVVPNDISGQVCAVSHFGQPGTEEWREAGVVVEILPADQDRAIGVVIGNPPPDGILTAGRSLLLYGTAYNAPDNTVTVSILLENGRILNEGATLANFFGYWELELFIPANAEGLAQITASVGDPGQDDFAQYESTVTFQAD